MGLVSTINRPVIPEIDGEVNTECVKVIQVGKRDELYEMECKTYQKCTLYYHQVYHLYYVCNVLDKSVTR